MSKGKESNWLAGVVGALAAAAVVSEVAGETNRQLRRENRRLRNINKRHHTSDGTRIIEVDIASDLRRCTWDSERTRMLKDFARLNVVLSSNELVEIVNTYTFSSDAVKAVRLMKGFVTDSWRLQIQLENNTHMFSTDVRRALR